MSSLGFVDISASCIVPLVYRRTCSSICLISLSLQTLFSSLWGYKSLPIASSKFWTQCKLTSVAQKCSHIWCLFMLHKRSNTNVNLTIVIKTLDSLRLFQIVTFKWAYHGNISSLLCVHSTCMSRHDIPLLVTISLIRPPWSASLQVKLVSPSFD